MEHFVDESHLDEDGSLIFQSPWVAMSSPTLTRFLTEGVGQANGTQADANPPSMAPTESGEFVTSTDSTIIRETMRVYGSLYLIFFLLFCFLRRRYPKLYNIRSWVPKLESDLAKRTEHYGFFSWSWKVFKVSDDELLENCGMDATCFCRCLRLGFKLCSFGVFTSLWLIPVFLTAEESYETRYLTDIFVKMSMANLPSGSHRFYGVVVTAYVIFFYSLYLITKEYDWFITYRHKFLSQRKPKNYAIYVSGIPAEHRSSFALGDYFRNSSYGEADAILQAHIAMDIPKLEAKVARRERVIAKLEHCMAFEKKTGLTSTHRNYKNPNILNPKNPNILNSLEKKESIPAYQKELDNLNKDIATAIGKIKNSNDRFRHKLLSQKVECSRLKPLSPLSEDEEIVFEEDTEFHSGRSSDGMQIASSLGGSDDDETFKTASDADKQKPSSFMRFLGLNSQKTPEAKETSASSSANEKESDTTKAKGETFDLESSIPEGSRVFFFDANSDEQDSDEDKYSYAGDEETGGDDEVIKEVSLIPMSSKAKYFSSAPISLVKSGLKGIHGSLPVQPVADGVGKVRKFGVNGVKKVAKLGVNTISHAPELTKASLAAGTELTKASLAAGTELTKTSLNVGEAVVGAVAPMLRKGEDGEPRDAGFVVFKDLFSTHAARQMLQHPSADTMVIEEPPTPDQIFWQNVGMDHTARKTGNILSMAATVSLCFFWSIPMAFLSSLTDVHTLEEKVPFIRRMLEKAPGVEQLFNLIAPLLLVLLNELVLPVILTIFSVWQGHIGTPTLEASVFVKLSTFVLIQTFFVSAVSGTISSELTNILNNPELIVELLANSLPAQSSYFIQIALVFTLLFGGLDLLRVHPLGVAFLRRFVGPNLTAKERKKTYSMFNSLEDPPEFYHAEVFAQIVLFYVVFFVYALIAPISCVFLGGCFLLCESGYRYHFIHNHKTEPDSGGKIWKGFINILMASMLIGQLTLIGYLLLKKAVYAVPVLAPMLAMTIIYMIQIAPKRIRASSNLPSQMCNEVDGYNKINEEAADSNFAVDAYLQPALKNPSLSPEDDFEDDTEDSISSIKAKAMKVVRCGCWPRK